MYPWIRFVHILAAFLFVLTHGASTKVIMKLPKEKSPEKLAALLELSSDNLMGMYLVLLVMMMAGVANGLIGHYWSKGWIWVGLGLLLLVSFSMFGMATRPLSSIRKALGLPYFEGNKGHPADFASANPEEATRLIARLKPGVIAGIGYGGLVLILYFMAFKPF